MTDQRTGRSVGQRIRQVCAIAASIGPCTYKQVYAQMTDIALPNASKYLSRAVGLGLMTVERSERPGKGHPAIFTVVPGWELLLDRHATTRIVKRVRKVPVSRWEGVSSVWGMAK